MKKLLCMALVCITLGQGGFSDVVMANEFETSNEFETVQVESVVNGNTERRDIIEIRIRTHNGVLQYRRWNSTRNRYVDPEWINC